MTERYLTGAEIGERFRIDEQTVYRMRKRGDGPRPVKQGNKYLYPLSEVERYESELRAAAGIPEPQQVSPAELRVLASRLGLSVTSPGMLRLAKAAEEAADEAEGTGSADGDVA